MVTKPAIKTTGKIRHETRRVRMSSSKRKTCSKRCARPLEMAAVVVKSEDVAADLRESATHLFMKVLPKRVIKAWSLAMWRGQTWRTN